MKKVISSNNVPSAVGPYSCAIEANGTVYVSGQLPISKDGIMASDIKSQTKQSLINIQNILKENNMDMSNIVKTTVLLSDMADFQAMNEIYATFFSGDYPARVCFTVKELPKKALVEIECIAVK